MIPRNGLHSPAWPSHLMNPSNALQSFDREQTIARWRESLLASETVTAENVRELEGHLRDGMSGLTARGLSEEEAFLIASRRLGGTEIIAAEFEANDPHAKWRHRAFWIVAGLLFGQALFGLWDSVEIWMRRPLNNSHWWLDYPSITATTELAGRFGLPLVMTGAVLTIRRLATGRLTNALQWLSTRCRHRWSLWLCALSPVILPALIHWHIQGSPAGRFESWWDNFLHLSWPVVLAIMFMALVPKPKTGRTISAR